MVSDAIRFLYVIGGYSPRYSRGYLNSMERFDTEGNTWEYLKPMPMALQDHRCVYLNGTIIVTGGMTSGRDELLNTIYLYRVASDTWSKSATVLQEGVYYHIMG